MVSAMMTQLKFLLKAGWIEFHLKGRVDSFNDRHLMNSIETVIKQHSGESMINLQSNSDIKSTPKAVKVALDLSDTEFLSLQMMHFLASLKRELVQKGGDLVLVQPSHPVRRQVEIFLGVKVFQVFSSFVELELSQHYQPRAEFLSPEPTASLA